ncbi:ABC transporter ATP-binding protein [Woeseia oceani]|uniref:ABC transporter domain-containing protein n=1 Tax=Woeseia oceani TaxID=1548547 RepID=A0A193LF69_9GAMM|nr:ABC transporter ATP-binding protein [Woeseia oceani]ANO51152.1 hypothetical protein BA177_07995 [Woeseia oceani]
MNSTVLIVENLGKSYGDVLAVDGVSFRAERGSVFGLLGPNGAGKSTTINCISGLLPPSSGRASINGADIVNAAKAAKQSLGVVPQDLALYDDLSAIDNLRFWGQAYGLRGSELDERVKTVLTYIGLGDRARDLPKTFSGGMKRRLNFGCAVVHRPAVLLLDEPTVGVDPQSRSRLFELVESERANGACIVYTTHYMEEAERLCDSVAIIDNGQLIAQGTVAALREQLDARDVLQLSGNFDTEKCTRAINDLQAGALDKLQIVSHDEGSLVLSLPDASQHLSSIFQVLDNSGATIAETSLRRPNLETLFMLLTGKELRE